MFSEEQAVQPELSPARPAAAGTVTVGAEPAEDQSLARRIELLTRYRNWRHIARTLRHGRLLLGSLPLLVVCGLAATVFSVAAGAGTALWIGGVLFGTLACLRALCWRELHALAEQTGGGFAAGATDAPEAEHLAERVGRYNESSGVPCLGKTIREVEDEIARLHNRRLALGSRGLRALCAAGESPPLRPARGTLFCAAGDAALRAGVAAGVVLSPSVVGQPGGRPGQPVAADTPSARPAATAAPSGSRTLTASSRATPANDPVRADTPEPSRAPLAAARPSAPDPGPSGASPRFGSTPAPPSAAPTPPPDRTDQELREFVRRQYAAVSARRLNDIMAGYAPQVDYPDLGHCPQSLIRAELVRYYERWPVGREEPEGSINLVTLEPGRSWEAQFDTAFYVESARRQEWIRGRTRTAFVLNLIDGQPKIAGVKSTVTQREKGALAYPASSGAGPAFASAPPAASPPPVWVHRETERLSLATAVNTSRITLAGTAFTMTKYTVSTLNPGVARFAPGSGWTIPDGVREYSHTTRFRGEVVERNGNFFKVRLAAVEFVQRSLRDMPLERTSDDRNAAGKNWSFNILPNGNLADATDPQCVFEKSR